MINYLKQYTSKTFEELVNGLIWFDLPFRLKAIFAILNSQIRPYKVYTALLSQTGTDAPTAIELENTIGTVTLEYFDVGYYKIVSSGLFIEDKTAGQITTNASNGDVSFQIFSGDEDTQYIQTFEAGVLTDELLSKTLVEIRVYN